ncbi:MAG: PBP1A family penicillin-binding protein [Acidobacteriota bacterium]
MSSAIDVQPVKGAKRRPKTVVLRDSPYPARRSFKDRLFEILNPVLDRVRPYATPLAKPRTLIILSVLAGALLFGAIYYYNKLATEIDARLQGSSLDNSVGIFTAPLKLSIGDHLPVDQLTAYLGTVGYQQRSAGEENVVGSFEVDGNAILVFPGEASSPGLNAVRIQEDKNGRIVSLTSPLTGERLTSASIQGELLAMVRDGDRRKKIAVQFSDIPENLRSAILATEDRRFFSHNGIDWRGILRALKADLDNGGVVQGGSTLTQQLIKNDFLTADRTLSRKLKEAAMAIILESRLSKQEIFTLYCNDVYLGQSGTFAINGFAQAAQVYFDKDLGDLTLGETAFLAGLICGPNRYSAHRDQARALERRNIVLDAMVDTDAITPEVAASAKSEPLQIKKHEIQNDSGTSYFIDYVQRFADDRLGPHRMSSQQRLTTTLDPRLQRAAYGAVTRQTEKLDKIFSRTARKGQVPQQVQGALVALDAHTGEVLAMVGGRSYDESQLNRATDAKRQPGSAFKPFVYAAALSTRSYTAASLISDTPQTFTYDGGRKEYKPSNYHGGFTNRNVTLREALRRSLNVPAVALAMSVGLGQVADVAQKSGLARPRVYPSMALGTSEVSPLELAAAYTAFANEGTALRPIPIKSISRGDKVGTTELLQAYRVSVFSPQVAYLMTNLLQSVVDEGTASRLRAMGLKGAIAGKTGTTSDGWFVGYTPRIVCVAWLGFDDNTDLRLKASDAAVPMWADFMKQALDLRPELGGDSFAKPGGIVTVEIDPATGCLASPDSLSRRPEVFIAGTEPYSNCSQELIAEASVDETLDEPMDEQGPRDHLGSETEAEFRDYDKIQLEVCADTGLLASPECPRTQKRTFDLSREPREMCSIELHSRTTRRQPPATEPVGDPETGADNRTGTNPWLRVRPVEKKARNRNGNPML